MTRRALVIVALGLLVAGRVEADEPAIRLHPVSSLVKVRSSADVTALAGAPLRVVCARGEREAGQVAVVADGHLRALRFEVGGLRASGAAAVLPAARVDARRLGTVVVREPSTPPARRTLRRLAARALEPLGVELPAPSSREQRWPDPLLPLRPFDLAPGELALLWLTFDVPVEARAGVYRGALRAAASDGARAELALELEVLDFALPTTPTLRTSVGLDRGSIALRHGVDGGALDALVARYRRALLAHRLSPRGVARPRLEVRGSEVALDWSSFDAEVEALLPLGLTGLDVDWCRLPSGWSLDAEDLTSLHPRRLREAHQAYRDRVRDALRGEAGARTSALLRATEAHLRARGWLRLAYVYAVDEPVALSFDVLRAQHAFVKAAAPGLPILQTLHPPGTVTTPLCRSLPPAYAALEGVVDVWVPETDCLSPRFSRRAQRRGEEVWTYVCIASQGRHANMWAIDRPATEQRLLFWQLWQAGLDGFLYWNATWWAQVDPWRDPMTYPGGNGDGSLFYPGEDGPVPSLRLALVRDGVEDFEYLTLLARLLDEGRGDAVSREEARRLLRQPPLAPGFTRQQVEPAAFGARRVAVGRAIVRLASTDR